MCIRDRSSSAQSRATFPMKIVVSGSTIVLLSSEATGAASVTGAACVAAFTVSLVLDMIAINICLLLLSGVISICLTTCLKTLSIGNTLLC